MPAAGPLACSRPAQVPEGFRARLLLYASILFQAPDSKSMLPRQSLHSTVRVRNCCRATGIMPALPKYLKASGPEEASAQRDLKDQLTQLDGHLAKQGPWITGQNISAGDLALGPKLYHVQVACKHFKVHH